ncbi:MAG TPA: hypothetical protein VH008_02170 [Pseudonocardia sp.]|nr:hypothetical protein [Pseudonocardia sp.]
MAATRRFRRARAGVYVALLGATLCTYAVGRTDVSRKFGNHVLDMLDLDEPLSPARPSVQRPAFR